MSIGIHVKREKKRMNFIMRFNKNTFKKDFKPVKTREMLKYIETKELEK